MVSDLLQVQLGSDEHGFLLEGATPSMGEVPALPGNTLLEWWSDQEAGLSGFMVSTGSQWGPFAVNVIVLDADPGMPEAQWEDVVEVSVDVAGGVAVSEIVDGIAGNVAVPQGGYRMRVGAKGRTQSAARDHAPHDEDAEVDHDNPLEHYLVTLWPSSPGEPTVLRQDSEFARDQRDPPAPASGPAEKASGIEAAWALVRDLRGDPGAHPLPGALGDLTIDVDVEGTPTRVFSRIDRLSGWPLARGGMFGPDPMETRYFDANVPGDDCSSDMVGQVAVTPIDATKPSRYSFGWNWVLDGTGPLRARPTLLIHDSVVTVSIERVSGSDKARSRVRLHQAGVPQAWVEHLTRLWTWQIVTALTR